MSDLYAISHNISNNWTMDQFHFHNEYEINLSISGGNRFFINDKIYNVKKGDLFLFNDKDLHKNVVPKSMEYERYLFFFKPEFIKQYNTADTNILELFEPRDENFINKLSLDAEQMLELVNLFKSAIYYHENKVYGSDIYVRIKLSEILLLVSSFYRSVSGERKWYVTPQYERIKPILKYIDANLAKKILLDDLADRFFISKYYLCNIFKSTTGFTVNEYITNKRIFKSRDLLLKGIDISTVGHMVGYTNDSHFIRNFKRLVGQTPKQYAKYRKE